MILESEKHEDIGEKGDSGRDKKPKSIWKRPMETYHFVHLIKYRGMVIFDRQPEYILNLKQLGISLRGFLNFEVGKNYL